MMTASSGIDRYSLPVEVAEVVTECLDELESSRFTSRIQAHDASLWRGNEDESRRRLGWLHVADTMSPCLDELTSFSAAVKGAGVTNVVILGMGGSSLGAEVLDQVFCSAPGFPRVTVLDSTVPGAIRAVNRSINLRDTLFIVSSKSGSTLEPNLLYKYFSEETRSIIGCAAGSQFIAITDAGSSLEETANNNGFSRIFLNPPDVGGRYSVLSLFGLVPATLMGIDVKLLLDRVRATSRLCDSPNLPANNPGVQLGTFIAGCARIGRDKLTLLMSPSMRSFGLWAEQLIAESTGKEGTGVVPVTGEPELPLSAYGDDRVFIYLRLKGDQCRDTDALLRRLEMNGFPCAVIEIADRYALGSEFFRWEYATAVVGALLGVNPFDQPDVQSAKDASVRTLEHFTTFGSLPAAARTQDLTTLLESLNRSDYLAITAFIRQRPETDSVFQRLRQHVAQKYQVSTTVGYGPRFLHSTGQLHKGGSNECALLQIVSGHQHDVPVPGKGYSFGTVANAQAIGDLQTLVCLNRRIGRIVLDDDEPSLLASALTLG